MATLGNKVTAPDSQYGFTGVSTSNQRATIFGPMSENGWGTQMGVWGGRVSGSNPTVALAIWNVSSNQPASRRAYTDTFTPSTVMTSSAGGSSLTANITHTNSAYSPAENAVKLVSGESYALGFLSTAFQFGHGQNNTSAAMHRQDVAGQPPSSPFVSSDSSTETQLSVWMTYTPNTAPSTPASLAPVGTSITTLTPTFNASFSDAQSSLGDEMNQYKIQLRQVGTTSLLWNQTYDASNTEQTANQVQRPYGGSALSAGVAYEWRVYVTDQFGEASSYTAWTSFTVNAGGLITIPGGATPNGKQTALNGYTFQGQWSHGSALAMTHVTCELRQNGSVIQVKEYDIANVASSAAPGTSFSATFAQFGFTDLSYGQSYSWRLKGKDSSGIYSGYSASTSFTTNTKPGTGASLTPGSSSAQSSLPKLSVTLTDADDTPNALGGNLGVTCRIKAAPYLANGAFVTDIGGWTGTNTGDTAGATATWSRETVVFPAGGLKANISASTAAAGIVHHDEYLGTWIPAIPGQTYTVRSSYQTDTANLHPQLQIRWYDAARAALSTSTEADWSPSVNTTYSRAFSATAPNNTAYFRIGAALRTAVSNVTGNAYFGPFTVDVGTRFSRTMTYNVSLLKWEYQTLAGTDDRQTVSFTGTVSGGNWSLTFNGVTSGNIAYNASAATVQTALQAMSSIGTGNVLVTGGPGPATPYVLTFAKNLGGTYQNNATVTNVSLTGSSPNVTIAHTINGVSNDCSVFGAYVWDCVGNDGFQSGDYSAEASFIYAQGPVVVVTAPAAAAVITTSRPTITWTATGQVKYQIKIFATGTSTIVYDSTLVTSASQSVVLPSGFLRNGRTYDIQVFVTDANPLVGSNVPQSFTLTYGAPATLAFTATPVAVGQDTDESAVLCAWAATSYPPSQFENYILDRRPTGAPVEDATILRRITNPNQVTFIDYLPESGTSFTYSLRQAVFEVANPDDVIESSRSEDATTVVFHNIVICSALNGGTFRAVLKFSTSKEVDHRREQTVLQPWGDTLPTILQSPTNYQMPAGTFTLLTDAQGSALGYLNSLRTLWNNGTTVCFRDERGRKIFGLLASFKERDDLTNIYTADISLTESAFIEGEVA